MLDLRFLICSAQPGIAEDVVVQFWGVSHESFARIAHLRGGVVRYRSR